MEKQIETEDSKYYVPDMSDIYPGYICEKKDEIIEYTPLIVYNYIPHVIEFEYEWLEISSNYNEQIRTKYLDKEDIESLGWLWSEQHGWFTLNDSDWLMTAGDDFKWLNIWNDSTGGTYFGKVKSINELRKLMQWLKIEDNEK